MLWVFSLALAAASAFHVVVAMPGGPGDTQAAQKPLRQFLDIWQASGADFTLEGSYFANNDQAAGFIKEKKPQIFVFAPSLFYANEKAEGLTAIAQLHVDHKLSEKWALVVRKDAPEGWEHLKGKTIASNLLADSNAKKLVTLGGKPLEGFATLEYVRSPLSALKGVRDGTSAAVLIDEAQVLGLDKLPFAPELKIAARTDDIPRPIIAVGKQVTAAQREQLKKAILAAGSSADAHTILMQFSVDGVAPSDDKLIASVRQRWK